MSGLNAELMREGLGCLGLVLGGFGISMVYIQMCERYGARISAYLRESAGELCDIIRILRKRKGLRRGGALYRPGTGDKVCRADIGTIEIIPQPGRDVKGLRVRSRYVGW